MFLFELLLKAKTASRGREIFSSEKILVTTSKKKYENYTVLVEKESC